MPSIKDTLLSYVQLTRAGHLIRVEGGAGTFTDKANTVQLRLSGSGNILTFENGSTDAPPAAAQVNAVTRASAATPLPSSSPPLPSTNTRDRKAETLATPSPSAADEAQIVHARYGHLCARKLVQLAKHGAAQLKTSALTRIGAGNKMKLNFCEQKCHACQVGKMARLKFAESIEHHATRPNDKVVADVCGPIWTVKNADETSTKYYLSTITDVYSRHLEILIIDSKEQASDHCISYLHASRISTRNDMRHFHTDGGTEYNRFEKVATSRGTKVTRTPIHTPQRNGIAERKNRTIMEMARALLYHANLPVENYWRYAVETAVVIHNRCTIFNEHCKTMHELFTGHAPDLSFMRVFGCDAYVRVVDPKTKLAPRSEKGIFLGYDVKREHCYRVMVHGAIVVSRDVRFAESDFTVERTKTTTQDSNTVADSSGESKHNRKVRTRAEMEENREDARTKNPPSIMHLGGDAIHSSTDTHHSHSRLEPDASAAVISDATMTSLTDEHPLDQRTSKRLKHAIAHDLESAFDQSLSL